MMFQIRNMVCDRCIMAVENILNETISVPFNVSLGKVDLNSEQLTENEMDSISKKLENLGFELLKSKEGQLVEKIKLSIQVYFSSEIRENKNLSSFLATELMKDYSALSTLFSSTCGMTIEQYYIFLKIEKVKELLRYDEANISEIAHFLGYSNVGHLSSQFKNITGMTPTEFKNCSHLNLRKSIDKIN